MRVVQKLAAPNDRNGNPRRLWIIYEVEKKRMSAYPVKVIDEGYTGRPDAARVPELSTIEVSPSVYRDWIVYAKASGIFVDS